MPRSLPLALLSVLIPTVAHAEPPAIIATAPGLTVEVAPAALTSSFGAETEDTGVGGTVRLRAGYRTHVGLEVFAEALPLVYLPAKDAPVVFVAAGVRQSLRLGKIMPHVSVAAGGEVWESGVERPGLTTSVGVDYLITDRLSAGLHASYYRSSDLDGSSGGYQALLGGASLGWRL